MNYYFENHKFNIPEKFKKELEKLILKTNNIIYYNDIPLMFILEDESNKNRSFLMYIFTPIDADILKYYILEKDSEEIKKYLSREIDIRDLLYTNYPEKLAFVEKIENYKNYSVEIFNKKDLENTLSMIEKGLFH